MRELAKQFTQVFRSCDPESLFCYSPAILRLGGGRLVITIDIRDVNTERKKSGDYSNWYKENDRSWWCGKIFISDDGGKSFVHKADFPFIHARPFLCGKRIYVLGHCGNLAVMYSDDLGETWSETSIITENQQWHQAPCSVVYENDNVYLVMERFKTPSNAHWKVESLAPVLMRGNVNDDLTKKENWTFASEIAFNEVINDDIMDYFGIPFYNCKPHESTPLGGGRKVAPMGWLETNVVKIEDSKHVWYGEHTFHLFSRLNTGWVNHGSLLKVVEKPDGSMETMLEKNPSKKNILFINIPGGQMKFYILYDDISKTYWLLGSQSTDSMVDISKMDEDRFDMPNNERNRLVLHFSKNCVDWCFAGVVSIGGGIKQSRHYASMCIDGEDLCVVSRSGDEHVHDAHDTNIITFHRVSNFRNLIY